MRLIAIFALTAAALLVPATSAFAPCHTVGFDPSSYTVGEAAGKVTVTVTNGGGQQTEDMSVDYDTVNGTAKAPGDYTSKSGTVTFGANAPGELTLDIPIKNDSSHEASETFTIDLSNVRPASSCIPPPSITNMTATVTITDNDPKPQSSSTPIPTRSSTPRPKTTSTPTPTPTTTAAPAATPQTSSSSPSPTTSPTPTQTPVADADRGSGGLSGGALAGIVAGVVVLGGTATFLVRRRFLA